MTTDASDSAVAATLFRVSKPDASLVTKQDLLDPAVTHIVGVAYKKLSYGQLRWHTFESELFAIVVLCLLVAPPSSITVGSDSAICVSWGCE